ncbi:helix-turn-helix domain-containing protein [Candidatus Erwinia dacicola]
MMTLETRVEMSVLHRQGMSIRAIARQLSCSRETVRRYIRSPLPVADIRYKPCAPRPCNIFWRRTRPCSRCQHEPSACSYCRALRTTQARPSAGRVAQCGTGDHRQQRHTCRLPGSRFAAPA